MPVWVKCNVQDGADAGSEVGNPGDRVDIDAGGSDYVKVLSPKFLATDGDGEYTRVGYGCLVIMT